MANPSVTRIDDATPSTGNVDVMLGVVLAGAGAGVVTMLGTPLVFELSDPDFNPLIVLAGLLAVLGAYYLVRGLLRRRVVGRFGATVFEQQGHEVYVGETLRGRILTSRPLSAPEGFLLRLRCIERKGESFDETRRRARDAILWETSHTVRTADSSAGIPVEFLIPQSALAEARLGAGDWTLKVSATADGASYEATFGLRVYSGARSDDDNESDGGDDDDGAPDDGATEDRDVSSTTARR